MRLTEMLSDVISWTSAPVLNNRGNGSRPGMMFTMTHTDTYTDTHTDTDTDTDTHTDTDTDRYIHRYKTDTEGGPRLIPPQTDIAKGDNITLLKTRNNTN